MKARDVISFSCHYRRPRIRCKAVAKTLVANGISAGPLVASDGSVVGIISSAMKRRTQSVSPPRGPPVSRR
jgi:hypothetical protein